ncbi:hypothetical protein [Limimaricola hongkongensis]|nr:hypothetical protein [Limimaricola hongkongensis]
MSAPHRPTEAQISDLIERFSPRQLAIGYLRAQHRARLAAAEAETMLDIEGWLRGASSAQRAAVHEGGRK